MRGRTLAALAALYALTLSAPLYAADLTPGRIHRPKVGETPGLVIEPGTDKRLIQAGTDVGDSLGAAQVDDVLRDRDWYMLAPAVFQNCGSPCLGVVENNADSALVEPDGAAELLFVLYCRVDADTGKAALLGHEFRACPQVVVADSTGSAIFRQLKPAALGSAMPQDTIGGGFVEALRFAGINRDSAITRYNNNAAPWETPQVIYNHNMGPAWTYNSMFYIRGLVPGEAVVWKVRNVEVYAGADGVWTETTNGRVFFQGMVYARRR